MYFVWLVLCFLYWDAYWIQQVCVVLAGGAIALALPTEWVTMTTYALLWTSYGLWHKPIGLWSISAGAISVWDVITTRQQAAVTWKIVDAYPILGGILCGFALVFGSKRWMQTKTQNMSQENIYVAE
jgi:hypothetical protein